MCFIQNYKGPVVEGFTAHERQGRGDDSTVAQAVVHGAGTEPFREDFPKRVDVDRELFIQGAWQETQLLPRFHGGPRQDNPFNTTGLQRFGGYGAGAVTLARTGRSDTKGKVIALNRVDVVLLGGGVGGEGFVGAGWSVGRLQLSGGIDFDDVAVRRCPVSAAVVLEEPLFSIVVLMSSALRVRSLRHG